MGGNSNEDFILKFSPSLNCIIGGRGSGKSTLIEILQYALAQECSNKRLLEFICEHANIYLLYILEGKEYMVELALPNVKTQGKSDILQFFKQNEEDRFGYKYRYDRKSIENITRNIYTTVYEIKNKKFNKIKNTEKDALLLRMFDTRYSINNLVQITSEEIELSSFISELLLRDSEIKNLTVPYLKNKNNYGKQLTTLKNKKDERSSQIKMLVDDFNLKNESKLKIVYKNKTSLMLPDFKEILFGMEQNIKKSFRNYSIGREDVVEFLYSIFENEKLENILEIVIEKKLPESKKNLLIDMSNYHFEIEADKWSTFNRINNNNIDTIFLEIQKLFFECCFDALIQAIIENIEYEMFTIELNVNSKVAKNSLPSLFKNIEVLSLGQRVVTMLDFILACSEFSNDYRPLILDQPEDNLDNSYIYYHLVEQFRKIKNKRQLIIATHNATIVTNSMTDQVIVLESNGKNAYIADIGYISENKIRHQIINNLEGGIESFQHKVNTYKIFNNLY